MDNRTRDLKGSKSRDEFKYWHKQKCSKKAYGLDLDFIPIVKNPNGIACLIDFKFKQDKITFAEAIAYNDLKTHGYRLFIVQSDELHEIEDGKFEIREFIGADPKPEPPNVVLTKKYFKTSSWVDYERFENKIRNQFRQKCSQNRTDRATANR